MSVTDDLRPGDPIPPERTGGMEGFVVGNCGHRVAGSEWRAGFRNCERCGESAGTTCTECGGLGETDCEECDGGTQLNGEPCEECSEMGTVECAGCNGEGTVSE